MALGMNLSNPDLTVEGRAPDGSAAVLAVEVRDAEQAGRRAERGRTLSDRERTRRLYPEVHNDFFKNPLTSQLAAEHLLANCIRKHAKEPTTVGFMIIAPKDSLFAQSSCRTYRRLLADPETISVPFIEHALVQCAEVIGMAGAGELEARLQERYTDVSPIRLLIDDWHPASLPTSG